MNTVEMLNGTMWVFAVILIVIVVVQSLAYLRMALKFNSRYKVLSKDEVNQAIRTGSVAAVGPAFSSMTIAISLMAMIGSGVAFMRCGIIGAPMTELLIANMASQTVGVEFNTPEFTPSVFALCLFAMTVMSAPYILNTIISLKPLDKVVDKGQSTETEKKKRSFLPYMSTGAIMGMLGNMLPDYLTTGAAVTAFVVALAVNFGVTQAVRKINNKILESFAMAISMVVAMAAGQIAVMI